MGLREPNGVSIYQKATVRYKFDALGRRTQRYFVGGKENTKFIYDGQDVLADDNAGTLTKYQNGPGIDNKLSVKTGSAVNYFLADHLGSTNGLTDSVGALAASTAYDSFGNPNTGFSSRYQFTGREYGRVSASQAESCEFDPRRPLQKLGKVLEMSDEAFSPLVQFHFIAISGCVGEQPSIR